MCIGLAHHSIALLTEILYETFFRETSPALVCSTVIALPLILTLTDSRLLSSSGKQVQLSDKQNRVNNIIEDLYQHVEEQERQKESIKQIMDEYHGRLRQRSEHCQQSVTVEAPLNEHNVFDFKKYIGKNQDSAKLLQARYGSRRPQKGANRKRLRA